MAVSLRSSVRAVSLPRKVSYDCSIPAKLIRMSLDRPKIHPSSCAVTLLGLLRSPPLRLDLAPPSAVTDLPLSGDDDCGMRPSVIHHTPYIIYNMCSHATRSLHASQHHRTPTSGHRSRCITDIGRQHRREASKVIPPHYAASGEIAQSNDQCIPSNGAGRPR